MQRQKCKISCGRMLPVDRLFDIALKIYLRHLDGYSDDELNDMANLPPDIKTRLLRKFLVSRAFAPKCVNPKEIIKLSVHARLRELNLIQYSIDDDVLLALRVCKQLEVLRIDDRNATDAPNLTAGAFEKALAEMSQLHTFIVHNCLGVTDDVAEQIAHSCPRMEHLVFRYCPNFGDRGLASLAKLQHLRALDMSSVNLTDAGLNSVIDETMFMTNLQELHIEHCRSLRGYNFGQFAAKCPSLSIFSCVGSSGSATDMNGLNKFRNIEWFIEW